MTLSSGALAALTRATDLESLLDALVGVVGERKLFVFDHAVDHLLEVAGSGSIEIDDPLRSDLLSLRSHERDGGVLVPLPEGRQPVFVLACAPDDVLPADDAVVLAAVLSLQRRRLSDLERCRRRSEMVIASEIQWDALPPRADRVGEWSVGAGLEPAYEVAGDLFDIAIRDDSLWMASLDGMGHGLAATHASLTALGALRNARNAGVPVDEQMSFASAAVHGEWEGDRFVTGVVCEVGVDHVSYAMAGHEPARRFHGGEVVDEELEAGVPLGVEPDRQYREQRRDPLEYDDGIVLVSDGAHEVVDEAGNPFGADALDDAVSRAWSPAPLATVHGLLSRILHHVADADVSDDITAVVAVRRDDR